MIKDSEQLHTNLKTPPNARLFTANATSMYTNTDTTVCLQSINSIFDNYQELNPINFLIDLFLSTLEAVMNNNRFYFGDSFWLQLQGTTMGAPAAPLYSIIIYRLHKNKT
jgi:hypothetical protein